MKYIHPKQSIYQSYDEMKNNPKEKTYKDYFEYCVKETGLPFDYPSDWNSIQDGIVDGVKMLSSLNTVRNKLVLEKIREIIGLEGYIPLGIDRYGYVIYMVVVSGLIGFGRDGSDGSDNCFVPTIEEETLDDTLAYRINMKLNNYGHLTPGTEVPKNQLCIGNIKIKKEELYIKFEEGNKESLDRACKEAERLGYKKWKYFSYIIGSGILELGRRGEYYISVHLENDLDAGYKEHKIEEPVKEQEDGVGEHRYEFLEDIIKCEADDNTVFSFNNSAVRSTGVRDIKKLPDTHKSDKETIQRTIKKEEQSSSPYLYLFS